MGEPERNLSELEQGRGLRRDPTEKSLLTVLMEHQLKEQQRAQTLVWGETGENDEAQTLLFMEEYGKQGKLFYSSISSFFLMIFRDEPPDERKSRPRKGPFQELAVDWTPKMVILFASPNSFRWCADSTDPERANLLTNTKWNEDLTAEVGFQFLWFFYLYLMDDNGYRGPSSSFCRC